MSDARQDRDRLARRVAEAQWDLGGLVYEMAARDHFRLDVLTARAADLQDLDTELATLERAMALEEHGAAGECSNCGSLYVRGALFCSQCGSALTT